MDVVFSGPDGFMRSVNVQGMNTVAEVKEQIQAVFGDTLEVIMPLAEDMTMSEVLTSALFGIPLQIQPETVLSLEPVSTPPIPPLEPVSTPPIPPLEPVSMPLIPPLEPMPMIPGISGTPSLEPGTNDDPSQSRPHEPAGASNRERSRSRLSRAGKGKGREAGKGKG